MGFTGFLQHGYNLLMNRARRDPVTPVFQFEGVSAASRPDRMTFRPGYDRTTVTAVYNRIAIDCAALAIQHVMLDEDGRYESTVDDSLNTCLTLEANRDQTGRAFIQDVIQSLCDEGCIAVVPVQADTDPEEGAFHVEKLRVGKILQWFPKHVQVSVYNEDIGIKQEIIVPKEITAIIENPLYAVMNEPNSTARRLMQKMQLLDRIDESNGANRLDLIVQLPYIARTPQRKAQAEQRMKDIEMQLAGSKYGIAYTDGTERITQLNRAVENTLPEQIQNLRTDLYNQLGMTDEVFKGTADDATMLNYYARTTEPLLSAVVDEFKRKFLTKTARSQKHSIMFFRDPFRLVPATQIAEIADKMTRNEILSPNEIRAIIGYKPSKDPASDELRNRNLNQDKTQVGKDPIPEGERSNSSE